MRGISRIAGLAVLAGFPVAGWAGTSSGTSSNHPDRDLGLEVDVVCAISINITPTTSGLPTDQHQLTTNFTHDFGSNPEVDKIDFTSVNLLLGTTVLSGGGDAYDYSSDNSVNVVGALDVTITHTCATAPSATIEATTDGLDTGVTVRWSNDHEGGATDGWETSKFNQLTTSTSTFTYTNGTVMPVDVGFNIPKTTATSTETSTVTFTTAGGS